MDNHEEDLVSEVSSLSCKSDLIQYAKKWRIRNTRYNLGKHRKRKNSCAGPNIIDMTIQLSNQLLPSYKVSKLEEKTADLSLWPISSSSREWNWYKND